MVKLALVPITRLAVTCYDQCFSHKLSHTAFKFNPQRVTVGNSQQIIIRQPTIKVVHDDYVISRVTVPPLPAWFVILVFGGKFKCITALSGAGRTNQNDDFGLPITLRLDDQVTEAFQATPKDNISRGELPGHLS
ncbi:hypothetical protein [Duck circovirus]|uniref:Uncharacterized protein n=1 Tax=Duck circovirus TaxID=324685 RepID=Q4F8M2_9CIRC|nr:hypothetical protein [Duck circovirus]AAZ07883.1 hypothetical protein [Duck circovirus]